jgi:predicted O-methyltransferase YrrM
MGAALQLGVAFGVSPIAIAERLPPIEAVMVRKINEEINSRSAERVNI